MRVSRLGDDSGIVPTTGENESHIGITEDLDFVDRLPWRDMVASGGDGENFRCDIGERNRLTIDFIVTCGQAVFQK